MKKIKLLFLFIFFILWINQTYAGQIWTLPTWTMQNYFIQNGDDIKIINFYKYYSNSAYNDQSTNIAKFELYNKDWTFNSYFTEFYNKSPYNFRLTKAYYWTTIYKIEYWNIKKDVIVSLTWNWTSWINARLYSILVYDYNTDEFITHFSTVTYCSTPTRWDASFYDNILTTLWFTYNAETNEFVNWCNDPNTLWLINLSTNNKYYIDNDSIYYYDKNDNIFKNYVFTDTSYSVVTSEVLSLWSTSYNAFKNSDDTVNLSLFWWEYKTFTPLNFTSSWINLNQDLIFTQETDNWYIQFAYWNTEFPQLYENTYNFPFYRFTLWWFTQYYYITQDLQIFTELIDNYEWWYGSQLPTTCRLEI